jgi:DNA polymerase kappa
MDKPFDQIFLLQTYLGIASNVVQPHAREERKSIGAERTFSALDSKEKILAKLEEVAEELEKDMEEEGWVGKTVTLKFKLDTYQSFTRAKSFGRWVSKKEELFNVSKFRCSRLSGPCR